MEAHPLSVRDVMTSTLVTLSPGQSLPLARALMRRARVRHLPVVDAHGRLVGLVTDRDLLEAAVTSLSPLPPERREDMQHNIAVSRIMQKQVMAVSPDTMLAEAAKTLRDRRIGCLPVVKDGRVIGILTEADVLSACIAALERGEVGEPEYRPFVPTLRDIMSPTHHVVEASQPALLAHGLMTRHDIRHLPVLIASELFGLVSEAELTFAEALHPHPERLLVGEVVKRPALTINHHARLEDVAFDMANAKLDAALVMKSGELVGIITSVDLSRELGCQLRSARRTSGISDREAAVAEMVSS